MNNCEVSIMKSNQIIDNAMAKKPKEKIMFTCDVDTKQRLQDLADSERRTLSNLVEILVCDALDVLENRSKTMLVTTSDRTTT